MNRVIPIETMTAAGPARARGKAVARTANPSQAVSEALHGPG